MWLYPPLEDAMTEAEIQEVETYVSRHQKTVELFIETGTIMDLCMSSEWRTGTRVSKLWWEQDGVYVKGMRTEV